MAIIIYTKTGCPWCAEALALLEKEGVPYEEREVLGNPAYFAELVEKSGQTKTPTVDADGHIIADSDAKEIQAFLAQKGMLGRNRPKKESL